MLRFATGNTLEGECSLFYFRPKSVIADIVELDSVADMFASRVYMALDARFG